MNKVDEQSDALAQLNEACTRKWEDIQRAKERASLRTTKAKTVSGVLTAGVGTIGGGTTAAVRENADATLVLGLVTLGLSIAGGVTTAILDPGAEEIESQNAKLNRIATALEKFNKICGETPESSNCRAARGAALGLCTDSK